MTIFTVLTIDDFRKWLFNTKFGRPILLIQNHHTYSPSYKDFTGSNHLALLKGMEDYHVNNNGWDCIAQNFTTFPDGKIALCRPLDKIPAGIKGVNHNGICLEHLGNFDLGRDLMTEAHKKIIIELNALLAERFVIPIDTRTIVYHHWYDMETGGRTNGSGMTKSCPGTNFFAGNTTEAARVTFLPLIEAAMNK